MTREALSLAPAGVERMYGNVADVVRVAHVGPPFADEEVSATIEKDCDTGEDAHCVDIFVGISKTSGGEARIGFGVVRAGSVLGVGMSLESSGFDPWGIEGLDSISP